MAFFASSAISAGFRVMTLLPMDFWRAVNIMSILVLGSYAVSVRAAVSLKSWDRYPERNPARRTSVKILVS